VDSRTGIITTIAGFGTDLDDVHDGGQAIAATLFHPAAIAFDASDNLFIADVRNQRIRRIDAATQIITTVAGTGEFDEYPEIRNGVPATSTPIDPPSGLAVDASGNIFI